MPYSVFAVTSSENLLSFEVYLIDLNRSAFDVEQKGYSIKFRSFFKVSIQIGSPAKRSPRSMSTISWSIVFYLFQLVTINCISNLGILEAWNGEPLIYFYFKFNPVFSVAIILLA
jgi:hypothetical protein